MKNVLVIDDDVLSAELIKCFLIDESCILSIEYSGDSGLNLFLDKFNFDLIFLDLHLPGKDGFGVCAAI